MRISSRISVTSTLQLKLEGGISVTERLYLNRLEDGYRTTFAATVSAIDETRVVLDRSLFYPLGGGQHWDTGTLEGPNGTLDVTEVRGRNDVHHTVGSDHQLEVGDEVVGQLNWEQRYAHMRMHTAQHLISGTVYEMFGGARTVGNQIHADRSRIDFNPIVFDEAMLNALTDAVNQKIDERLPVTDSTMTRDAMNAIMPADRTNMDLLPAHVQELRVVQIGDRVDMCPCAGTHVLNLEELGHMTVIGKKSKGKGTQRLSYTLGEAMVPRVPVHDLM